MFFGSVIADIMLIFVSYLQLEGRQKADNVLLWLANGSKYT